MIYFNTLAKTLVYHSELQRYLSQSLQVSLLHRSDVIHKFVRDIYYKRFPELESLVPLPLEYMKTVKVSATADQTHTHSLNTFNLARHENSTSRSIFTFSQTYTVFLISMVCASSFG